MEQKVEGLIEKLVPEAIWFSTKVRALEDEGVSICCRAKIALKGEFVAEKDQRIASGDQSEVLP